MSVFSDRKKELVYERTVRAVRNHFWTIARQLVYAVIVVGLWYVILRRNHVHYSHEDKDIFLVGVLFITGGSWIFKATKALDLVTDDMKDMVHAVKRADRDTIIDLRDDHMPLLIPFYLTILSIIIEVVVMMFPFESTAWGCVAIFMVTMVLLFFGAVIYQLEDPTEGGWVRDRIMQFDETLLTLDVEDEFGRRWKAKKKETVAKM